MITVIIIIIIATQLIRFLFLLISYIIALMDIFVTYHNYDSDNNNNNNNNNNNTKTKMQTTVCVGVTDNQYLTFLL